MSDPSDRLERAIAQLGAEHEPPAGWEARVLAAVEPRSAGSPGAPERRPWLRRWWPVIPSAVLAAAVLVLWLRPVKAEAVAVVFRIDRGDPSRGATRGTISARDVPLGSQLDLGVRGGGEHRALWVYRDGKRLVVACPGDARCDAGGAPRVVLTADQIGSYQAVALSSGTALPAPLGDYDRDMAALAKAGVDAAPQEFRVH